MHRYDGSSLLLTQGEAVRDPEAMKLRLHVLLVLIVPVWTVFLVLRHWHGGFVWDESTFYRNLLLYQEHGLSRSFLLGMDNQSPGPFFQILHSLFEPVTDLHPGGMRLLNFGMAIGIALALGRVLSQWVGVRSPYLIAAVLFSVPGFNAASAPAMTDVPTLLFAMGFVYASLYSALAPELPPRSRLALSALAGLFLGIAVISRANFLVLAFAAPALAISQPTTERRRGALFGSGVTLAVALACCLPLFWIWRGVTPPSGSEDSVSRGLNLWNAVLLSIYATTALLALRPAWFRVPWKEGIAWCAAAIVIGLLNQALLGLEHRSETVEGLLAWVGLEGTGIENFVAYLTPAAFATYTAFFTSCALRNALAHRADPVYLFAFFSAALLLASTLLQKNNYGLRYTAHIAPFLVMMLAPRLLNGWSWIGGRLLGLVLGVWVVWHFLSRS